MPRFTFRRKTGWCARSSNERLWSINLGVDGVKLSPRSPHVDRSLSTRRVSFPPDIPSSSPSSVQIGIARRSFKSFPLLSRPITYSGRTNFVLLKLFPSISFRLVYTLVHPSYIGYTSIWQCFFTPFPTGSCNGHAFPLPFATGEKEVIMLIRLVIC